MSVNAPTPSGQRSRQMQTPTAEPRVELKREVNHRHEPLDQLSDDVLALYAYNDRMSVELARGLNATSAFPYSSPDQVAVDESYLTEAHAAAIMASALTTPQKWALQRRKQRQAIAMSRVIGILHGLSREYVQQLAQTSFLLDSYVVSTWHRAMARISGSVIRWAESFGSEQTRDDLTCAFEQLEKGQEGTQVTLTNVKLPNGKMGIDVWTTRVNPARQIGAAS